MGSCLSSGIHGKKRVASGSSLAQREEERRYDGPVVFTRSGRGEDKQPVLQLDEPVELVQGLWEHLPNDLTRFILSKLPLSSLIHLRCVNKQWNQWILSSTIASPFSFNELVDCHVHPLIIFMYTLILVRDLDNQSPDTQAALSGRSSLARFFHIKLRLETHYADVFGWRPNLDAV
ncbi:unnamed protein product [Calypogeia fissa]